MGFPQNQDAVSQPIHPAGKYCLPAFSAGVGFFWVCCQLGKVPLQWSYAGTQGTVKIQVKKTKVLSQHEKFIPSVALSPNEISDLMNVRSPVSGTKGRVLFCKSLFFSSYLFSIMKELL